MSEKQWPEHISKRKRQEIAAHILLRHAVKPHQDEGVSEKDRVVEKGLSGHKHKAEKRTAAMFVHNRVPNFPPRRVRARSNPRRHFLVAGIGDPGRICSQDLSFHFSNDFFRLDIPPVNHQPTWAFGNPAAKENHDKPQGRADCKRAAPAQPDRNVAGVEQNECRSCAYGSADPV